MTLAETLLEKQSEWRPAQSEGRHRWEESLTEHGCTVGIDADQVDTVGSMLWEVTLRRDDETASVDLQAWAKSIANRATGLLEPLVVHEIDTTQNVALLRSESPATRSGAKLYYELRLEPVNGAVLRRYRYSVAEGKRTQIAFALTHETLAKVVEDIAR